MQSTRHSFQQQSPTLHRLRRGPFDRDTGGSQSVARRLDLSERGIAKVELFLNGFPMTTAPGA